MRLHGGAQFKLVTWFCRRIGAKPVLPSSNTQSANEVLINDVVVPGAPGTLPDGTPVFAFSGAYLYALRVPLTESDVLTAGTTPISPLDSLQTAVLPSDWSVTLIGPAWTPAGATGLSPITF